MEENRYLYVFADSYSETGLDSIVVVSSDLNELNEKIVEYIFENRPASTEEFEIKVVDLKEERLIDLEDMEGF